MIIREVAIELRVRMCQSAQIGELAFQQEIDVAVGAP